MLCEGSGGGGDDEQPSEIDSLLTKVGCLKAGSAHRCTSPLSDALLQADFTAEQLPADIQARSQLLLRTRARQLSTASSRVACRMRCWRVASSLRLWQPGCVWQALRCWAGLHNAVQVTHKHAHAHAHALVIHLLAGPLQQRAGAQGSGSWCAGFRNRILGNPKMSTAHSTVLSPPSVHEPQDSTCAAVPHRARSRDRTGLRRQAGEASCSC